ncbi:hypothetical protein BDV97DRAFT_286873 [Delphinella strobiligena]|nr:hypothetical protein BDV97DRAFT_286873 [Delphinella strobiligena]
MFVFHPNCALPPEGVKFVSAPNIRSTLDMVWTCLSILIICTWSVQCPNLPFQIHPQDWRQRIRLQLHRIWGKTVAMIIGVLLPEVMTAIAVDDWANAGSITRQILPQTEEDHIPWSRAHSFAADMGFFIIKFPENEPVTHLRGDAWYVDAAQLLFAQQCGIISTLPNITLEQLNDRSKSDPLVIFLAVLQVLSFGIQLIVRLVEKITSSPLEVTTLAVAICTFVIYILLWNKLKDVATPIYVSAARFPETHELRDLASSSIIQNKSSTPALSRLSKLFSSEINAILIAPWLGLGFGCLHCIAWNFAYPTAVEQRLWQASSLAIITSSALLYLFYGFTSGFTSGSTLTYFDHIFLGSIILLYTVARCFILVESIRSLAYLPPDAFVATWASDMPAIS